MTVHLSQGFRMGEAVGAVPIKEESEMHCFHPASHNTLQEYRPEPTSRENGL